MQNKVTCFDIIMKQRFELKLFASNGCCLKVFFSTFFCQIIASKIAICNSDKEYRVGRRTTIIEDYLPVAGPVSKQAKLSALFSYRILAFLLELVKF